MTAFNAHFRVNAIFRIYLLSLLLSLIATTGYAGDNTTVSVTATVLSKSNCKFRPPKTAALNFGTLDPANPVDKNASATIIFYCAGSAPMATFFISDDDGLYETGPDASRMKHTTITTEYLPYSFTVSPTSGTVLKNTDQTLTISGTVLGVDYQDASVGAYSDTVVISIEP